MLKTVEDVILNARSWMVNFFILYRTKYLQTSLDLGILKSDALLMKHITASSRKRVGVRDLQVVSFMPVELKLT